MSQDNQKPHTFEGVLPFKLEYLLYLPEGYDNGQKWPLIVFLHGRGERGTDLAKVKTQGLAKRLAEGFTPPFIVVSPQCPPDEWWRSEKLNVLLDDILARYNVDTERVYLTGLSMGGFATWDWATRYPDRFAAIAPICGGGEPDRVRSLATMPIWVFHGALDPIVPLKASQDMVEALRKIGNEVKFTVYPEATHDSWTQTYNNPELYEWFLQHTRKERG